MSHERKIPLQLRVWFFPAVPPRYALRFPPIPMRVLTQWIQWLLDELRFPQSKVALHFFFQFVCVQSFPTHFVPQKILWKKYRGDFVSFLCEGPLHKNISMLCRWGLTGGSNEELGRVGIFLKIWQGNVVSLFHLTYGGAIIRDSQHILQGDKSLCFLGLILTYQEQFGQQRIELGSSFYVASAGRSDFTLF